MLGPKVIIAVLLLSNLCFALHPYVDKESEEIDSAQHGQAPGERTTTCKCGWTNKGFNRIVGGEETLVNEYPFVVGISYRRINRIFCGGTIISPSHVITAAHCTYELSALILAVVVGEHNTKTTQETSVTEMINVKQQVIHRYYDPDTDLNDIALLFLKRNIQFSDQVGPACLPTEQTNLVDKYIKVMGWGHTSDKGDKSAFLKKVNLRIIPLRICSWFYGGGISLTNPTQHCTFSKNKDSCQGDSGGPNVWLDPETNRYTLVGVVSYGAQCATSVPGVNTDVSAYLDWIEENMKKTNPEETTCVKM